MPPLAVVNNGIGLDGKDETELDVALKGNVNVINFLKKIQEDCNLKF